MRELNKKDRLLDFIAFILADYSELLDPINYFFCDLFNSKEILSKYDKNKNSNIYRFYLNEVLDFEHLNNIINLNDEFDFTEVDKENLINYLNKNYRHGYPDDEEDGIVFGGNFKLDLDKDQFDLYLQEYKTLVEINQAVFISYFRFVFLDIEHVGLTYLEDELNLIKRLHLYSIKINSEVKLDFIEFHKLKYKARYIETFNNCNFFLTINKSDNDKFVLDFKASLLKQLTNIKELDINVIYSSDDVDFKDSFNEMKYNLFLHVFEGKPLSKNIEGVSRIYNDLLNEAKDYVSYLQGKGFENDDINNILNILKNNSFAELGFNFIKRSNLKYIQVFHLFYAFHYFDYLEENGNPLKSEKDFKDVVNFQSLAPKMDPEQTRKNFKNISNNGFNHYPFTNYTKTLSNIVSDTIANKELLKKIPPPKNLKSY